MTARPRRPSRRPPRTSPRKPTSTETTVYADVAEPAAEPAGETSADRTEVAAEAVAEPSTDRGERAAEPTAESSTHRAEPAAESPTGQAEAAADDDQAPLLGEDEGAELGSRWESIQVTFVDDPRRAVEEADGLVAHVMQQLAEGFARERETLEGQWTRGEDVSTEDLRVALQRYRSFFQRLLSASGGLRAPRERAQHVAPDQARAGARRTASRGRSGRGCARRWR